MPPPAPPPWLLWTLPMGWEGGGVGLRVQREGLGTRTAATVKVAQGRRGSGLEEGVAVRSFLITKGHIRGRESCQGSM